MPVGRFRLVQDVLCPYAEYMRLSRQVEDDLIYIEYLIRREKSQFATIMVKMLDQLVYHQINLNNDRIFTKTS